MKLSFKIISLVIIVILFILALDGIITIKKEIDVFNKRIEEDTLFWARIIKDSIIEIWNTSGKGRALELIEDVNAVEHRNIIRWLPLDNDKNNIGILSNYKKKFSELLTGNEITIRDFKKGYLYVYIPVLTKEKYGVIEISHSLKDVKKHLIILVLKVVLMSLFLLIISIILVWITGTWIIKKTLDLLIFKIKIISGNDFSDKNFLKSHNKFRELEKAMDNISAQIRDARENARIESDKRVEALEQLRHSERLAVIGRIASGLAHEIGTPINVIKGRAQLIVGENLKKREIIDYSNIIIEETNRITKIIQQLLNFAKIESSKYSLYNINDIINVVINLLIPTAKKSGIGIKFNLSKKIPLIMLDQTKIQQVFINVLINAFDCMPDGGKVFIEVDNEVISEKRYVTVKIKDQGIGISDDILDKIFDPFFTTKEYGRGTGLGLSIVKNIIDEHNGFIKVLNNDDRGSSFIIYLPCEVSRE